MTAIDGFPTRIKARLKELGIEQQALALSLKISEGAISNWFKGNRPSYENLESAASFLQVTPCWLAFGTALTPANPEEEQAVQLVRRLPEAQRAACLQALEAMGSLVPDPELMKLAEKAREKQERKQAKSAPPSDALAGAPHISESLQLSHEEARAIRKWLGDESEKMPLERPLTIACWKIAKLLGPGSVLRGPAPNQGKARASPDPVAEDATSASVAGKQAGRRKGKR